jgi:uncharacterized membrane protein YdfJ with MMPL/SSD domain
VCAEPAWGPLAGKLNSAQQNDSSAWLPNNAESTQVVELAKRFAPADIFPALVVYERPDGPITPADQAKAAADARRFATIQDVTGKVIGPVPSKDGRALQVVVPVRVAEEGNGWEELAPRIQELRSIAQADTGGLGVYVTGPAGYFADFSKVFSGFDSTLLYITAAIVIVILLVTYRSPVLWRLPLTTVFVALTAAQVMAIGVAVGLLAMLTLLPALLVIFGRWVFWPRRPTLGSPEPTEHGLWARIGQRMAPRPRLVWIVTAVVLGALALGVTQLEANGLQSKDSFRTKPEAVAGEAALARHFAAGTGNPVQVVGRAEAAGQLQATLAGTAGVTAVTRPVLNDGSAYLEGTLTSSPDSQASYDLGRPAPGQRPCHRWRRGQGRGGSAVNLDILRASRHDRDLVVPLVLVVVAIILGLLLRAVVAPLLLVATVVLSFGAALGVSALVFDHLFGFAGADPSFPLWTFVFLVALGTDYNIFLMTRVHEESKLHGTRRGALIGLAATGGVITSAGVVLAGTFAALGTLPLVFVTEIGFAVAFEVLLDTFVVRSVLVTALNLDVGRRIWWPSSLSRTQDVTLDQLAQDEPAAMTH